METTRIKENYLKDLHQICFKNNIPFVSFRSPQSNGIKTLVQFKGIPRELKSLRELNELSGFIITPFFNDSRDASFVLEPDVVVDAYNMNGKLADSLKQIRQYRSVEYLNGRGYYVAEKKEFIRQVKEIREEISSGKIKKAVLSRIHVEPKNSPFENSMLFTELCKKYPHAFVYVFQIPGAGCWIGATPEPLVLIRNGMVETISLAGTQKLSDLPPEKVQWPLKEIEEQDIVTQYIENVLFNFNVKDFQKTGPVTQIAGNLVHLKTRFLFDADAIGHHLGEFVSMLHPTPSICGSPKEASFKILERIEPHHREYYTGLLGPVNMNNETSLYVNLRCMKVYENKFALYLGAGITSGSVPENEWEETNQKKMTLMSVIEKLNHLC
ncbi:MAG: chorismate-binding protein [Bacteroidales bacterium]|nr:chorismate-binding protein [Bacteroidales bacterium]